MNAIKLIIDSYASYKTAVTDKINGARELLAHYEKLESENAELKAQHERDEKAMRVLAVEMNDKYAEIGCNLCPADKICTLVNQYDDVDRTDECIQILIAHAKREAGK